jgi:hypothetical protein
MRDLSSPDGALKMIVAVANTAGGMLLIGVENRSRQGRGVGNALDQEERLANLISDRISPRLVPEIEILPWRRRVCAGGLDQPPHRRRRDLETLRLLTGHQARRCRPWAA